MWKFEVVASSLSARWNLKRILSHLPTPGTPFFVTLYEALRPHGLNTSGYNLEGQAKLSDVVLTLSLHDTIRVRMSYDWIELGVVTLDTEQIPELVDITGKVFSEIRKIDEEVTPLNLAVSIREHLRIQPSDIEGFLSKHLNNQNAEEGMQNPLEPDAFAYNVIRDGVVSRITVAKSLVYSEALFVDTYCDYSSPEELGKMAERMQGDYQQILEMIGLSPQETE